MNILELDSYRLSDAVKFNDKLNPRIWDNRDRMRPEVREKLLQIADDFAQSLGVTDLELRDVTVSGSNAAYTYTPHSDIDLHLVVDLPEADVSDVYRELFDAKKYQYNDMHNIRIGGYDVELYVQNANQPHISQGIYSVLNDEWVQVPRRRKPEVDDISTRSKYETLKQHIEQAIDSGDHERIVALADKIKKMRQAGLEQHGEFGPENLAFKMLRTQGLIEKLYTARNATKDQLLSLDERRKKKKKKRFTYGAFGGYWYPGTAYAGQDHPAGAEGGGDGGGGESIRENSQTVSDEQILKDFIKFVVKELKIKHMPHVKLRRDPEWPKRHKTFGRYADETKTLEVAWGNRHLMDVLRTVAHELTHKHQHERDGERMGPDAGETGSAYENEANARAGVLMRDWARLHPEHFDAGQVQALEEAASGYIPTRAQAKDPRFSMALTVDIKPGQVGKEANKLKLKTDQQGHPQIAQANGLFEDLMAEYKRYKAKEDYSPDEPPGPESKPTMPAGTLRVDVSDMYDWYKIGQHISRMKGLGKHDFGAGPPSSIISFGDEDTEHDFIGDLKATGLDVTDIDPRDPKKRPGKPVKTDPTYNVNEDEDLDEVKMSPSSLEKFAASDEAKGIRAGFEAELIFRDAQGDSDEMDPEPDYDADERAYSIQQVIEFFQNDEYGYGMNDRQTRRLENDLDEAYITWYDEQMVDAFREEAEDLVREQLLNEVPMVERIHAYLTDGMELTDAQADSVIAQAEKAPRFTKLSDQDAYVEANPDYRLYLDAAEGVDAILDEDVEQSIKNQDGYYDAAMDEFRDNFSPDDSGFFTDMGLRWMSDIANEYNLDWPVWNMDARGNDGSRSWEEIGGSLQDAIDMPVKVSSGYHSTQRREGQWIIEPDGSLSPDDPSYEVGLEIVSPPMPLLMTIEKLKQVVDWANGEGNAYTNSTTGLHMGVSLPIKGGDVDYVKLILFMGDKYVLEQFGRSANTYTASALEKFKQNLRGGRSDPAGVVKLLKHGLTELAFKELQKGVGTSKYTSAHIQDGYIEFRSPGGDWLAKGDEEIGILENTLMRFARAMAIAGDPSAERQEYAKKLYKLVTEDNEQYADQLRLFSEFSAGTIDKEQLKKQWAEKTIGKEKKANQRWQLQYADGTPVPGQTYNGYTEDEVKTKIWSKYGREALDSGEYKLVNMSEEQQWEVYDVNTNKTLEIVKGRNKGEVADKVYDKYADQKIGFNVRPYEDPATLTPRAKLAKRIVTKPKDSPKYNYDIIDRATVELRVVDRFYATDDRDASNTFNRWLKLKDLPADTDRYGYRKGRQAADNAKDSAELQGQVNTQARMDWRITRYDNGATVDTIQNATRDQAQSALRDVERRYNLSANQLILSPIDVSQPGVTDVDVDVAQNFEPQQPQQVRSANGVPMWEVYQRDNGHVVHTFADHDQQSAWSQGQQWLRSVGAEPSAFSEFSVRPKMTVSENFADGKVKGKSRPGRVKRAGASCKGSVTDLRARAKKYGGERGKMYHWCANMKSGKKK